MKKSPIIKDSQITVNASVEGEPLEQKIERIIANKEPINGEAPIIYTERKEGIRASTNIRTDRFEIAVEAANKVAQSYKARREENASRREGRKKDGGAEPIQGKTEVPASPTE